MPASTIDDYFHERVRECGELGLTIEEPLLTIKAGTDRKQGRLVMVHPLVDNAKLAVSEFVICRGTHIHRASYGYYLIIDGRDYRAWDFDSHHGYHSHGLGHKRFAGSRISFKKVVSECWEIISAEEWLSDAVPDGPDDLR